MIKSVQKFVVEVPNAYGEMVEQEFATEAEAKGALARVAEVERVQKYCDAKGLEGKNAKGRLNVILDFLAYEAGVADEVEA